MTISGIKRSAVLLDNYMRELAEFVRKIGNEE